MLEGVNCHDLGCPGVRERQVPGRRHPLEMVGTGIDVDVQKPALRVWATADLEPRLPMADVSSSPRTRRAFFGSNPTTWRPEPVK